MVRPDYRSTRPSGAQRQAVDWQLGFRCGCRTVRKQDTLCPRHIEHLGGRHRAMDLGQRRPQCYQRHPLHRRRAILFPYNMNCDTGILSNTGAVYEHTFTQAGTYSYFCALHYFAGMNGVINVTRPSRPHPTPRPRPSPHPRPVSGCGQVIGNQ